MDLRFTQEDQFTILDMLQFKGSTWTQKKSSKKLNLSDPRQKARLIQLFSQQLRISVFNLFLYSFSHQDPFELFFFVK